MCPFDPKWKLPIPVVNEYPADDGSEPPWDFIAINGYLQEGESFWDVRDR